MKKNGSRPGSFMRFLAVLCAAALMIQAVPVSGFRPVVSSASEITEPGEADTAEDVSPEKEETKNTPDPERKEESGSKEDPSDDEKGSSEDSSGSDENDAAQEKEENPADDAKNEEDSSAQKEDQPGEDDLKTEDQKADDQAIDGQKTEDQDKDSGKKGDDTDSKGSSSKDAEDKKDTSVTESGKESREEGTEHVSVEPRKAGEEENTPGGTDSANDTEGSGNKKDTENSGDNGSKNDSENKDGENDPNKEGESGEGLKPDGETNDSGSEEGNDTAGNLSASEIEIRKGSEEVTGSVTIGKDDSSASVTLKASVNKEGVDAADCTFAWAVSRADSDSADPDAVTLDGESTDTVKISPKEGREGGRLKLTLTVTPKEGSSVSKNADLIVYTDYAVKALVLKKAADGEDETAAVEIGDSRKADVSDTLYAVLEYKNGASDKDKNDSAYSYQWMEEKDGEFVKISGETDRSFKVKKEGRYKAAVERKEDYRNQFSKESDAVSAEKISVDITWTGENLSREFDGTNTFSFEGTGKVTRHGTDEKAADDVKISTPVELELSGSDAGTYENVAVPFSGLDQDTFKIVSSLVKKITIEQKEITAKVTAAGKNFDNNTTVKEQDLTVDWEGLDSILSEKQDSFRLMLGEEQIRYTDLTYVYPGDTEEEKKAAQASNVEQETTVSVALTAEAAEKAPAVSGDDLGEGGSYANYKVGIRFQDAVIKPVSMTPEEVAEVADSSAVMDEDVVWVKASSVGLNALEGYEIGNDFQQEDDFRQTINANVDAEAGAVFYARSKANGEIARVAIANVKVDQDPPEVNFIETDLPRKLSREDYTNKYEVKDLGAGIGKIYYKVTEDELDPDADFDASEDWVEYTIPDESGDQNIKEVTIEIKVPAYGYVYIHPIDRLETGRTYKQHIVIYEDVKPDVVIECPDAADPTTEKASVKVTATDPEKGSGIQRIEFALLDSGNNTVSNVFTEVKDGAASDDTITFSNDQFTRKEECTPETLEDAAGLAKLAVEVSVNGAEQKLDGEYTLKVTAYDYCGNPSESELILVFDGIEPEYGIELEDDKGSIVDDVHYYNASQGGLKVTFEDLNLAVKDEDGKYTVNGNYTVTLKDKDGTEISKNLSGDSIEEKTGDSQGQTDGSSTLSGTVFFDAEEIRGLTDGKIVVAVSAVDGAGREAASDEEDFFFVLDTVAPVLTSSVTEVDKNKQGDPGFNVEDSFIVYAEKFTTTVEIRDININRTSFAAAYSAGTVDGIAAVGKRSCKKENDGMMVWSVKFEGGNRQSGYLGRLAIAGKFENGQPVSGTDFAGNPLKIGMAAAGSEHDEWEEKEEDSGSIQTVYERKVIKEIPTAELEYETIDAEYVKESDKKAYYNKTITAKITVNNLDPDKDTFKIAVRKKGDDNTFADMPESEYTVSRNGNVFTLTLPCDQDGHGNDGEYRIRIAGVNQAGTRITVLEQKPGSKTTLKEAHTSNANEWFTSAYTLVLDTASPVAEMIITPADEVANKELNTAYGNRYYFNGDHSFSVKVTDTNIQPAAGDSAPGTIRVSYAEKKSKDYQDASTVKFDAGDFSNTVSPVSQGTGATFTLEGGAPDGVRQYCIEGEDLAGNKVVLSTEQAADTIDTNAVLSDSNEGQFVSYPVVTDTLDLVMRVSVNVSATDQDGNKVDTTVYEVDSDGAVYAADPYRTEKSADIIGRIDPGCSKKTPYKLYFITSVTGEDGTTEDRDNSSDSEGFSVGAEKTESINAPAVFAIQKFYIEDLAGNKFETDLTEKNPLKIYLDTEKPDILEDKLAPAITVHPAPSVQEGHTSHGTNGTRLFNDSVPFVVQVKDPNFKTLQDPETEEDYEISTGSSGLKKITCEIIDFETGEAIKEDSLFEYKETKEVELKDKDSVSIPDDAGFTYFFNEPGNSNVTADVQEDKRYNSNSLRLVVTASDNAGNESTVTYEFGIDATDPTMELSYVNDPAVKNGFYFQESREAVITVTERNFDKDKVAVNVTGGTYETDGWKVTKAESGNGDSDKWTYTIRFTGDGNYILSIPDSIEDDAGNTGTLTLKDADSEANFHFVIDKNDPNVSVRMSRRTPDPEDQEYYYRADNCGITVTFDDNGREFGMTGESGTCRYSVTLYDSDGNVVVTRPLALEGFSADEIFGENGTERKTKYTENQTIVFTAEELAQGSRRLLEDGPCRIVVTAIDASGRRASSEQFIRDSRGCAFEGLTGRFILDTASPVVTGIGTASLESTDGQAYPITDNQVYTDTNSVYYNKNVKVQIRVIDSYLSTSQFTGTVIRDGSTNSPVSAEFTKTGTGLTAVYELKGTHRYSGLKIQGRDKAGNLLVLAEDYQHNTSSAVDDLVQTNAQAGRGIVAAAHGKVIDKTAPQATIRYTSQDQDGANVYAGETNVEGRKSAYFNKQITVSISFSDNYELDGKKLYAGEEGKEKAQSIPRKTAENDANRHTVRQNGGNGIRITKDGRSTYTAYGVDRALNPTKVTEKAPAIAVNLSGSACNDNQITAGAFTGKNLRKQSAYKAVYEMVLDQTAPTFTLNVSSPKSANKDLNSRDGRYYFNKGYTASVVVDELNYEKVRIHVKRGAVTSGKYNSRTAAVNEFTTTIRGSEKTFTDSVSGNGVYRYAVYGSDKAGNALVPSDQLNLETTNNRVVDGNVEKRLGSSESIADVSVHVVLDKIKPAGQLKITTGDTRIYEMNTNGDVTYAEPFRTEQTATTKIWVDDNVERTPVAIAYRIASTKSSDSKTFADDNYVYNRSVTARQDGKQIFQVTEYTFTDLAGNVTTYKSENKIYLDKDLPTVDKIAPTISIAAKAKSGTNGYRDGQPLFRSDVPLSIEVTDPDASNSSSGIAEVNYQMYVAGKHVGGEDRQLNDKFNKDARKHTQNYKDQELVYHINPTVKVGASSHNNNNLEVVVTATDYAGNKREARYVFGIDITAPTVRVTYDNNSAQNGEYFKENRVATIAVTERNFEPSKFRITTQSGASISGWSHSSNGGNGDRDVWTARVTYSNDGNYTLEVSGEDLVGNKANDIKYEGTAPRRFTVDKTAPAVTVTYDNNDVRNEKYYKASRTATINVNDVNFGGQNDIAVVSSGGGSVPSTVTFSGNTATIGFPDDGIYIFNGTVTDKAGNQTTIPEQFEFVIDTKKPVLVFQDGSPFKVLKAQDEKSSDHPVDKQFFTQDDFAPKVTVIDTNISTAAEDAVFEIIGTKSWNNYKGEIIAPGAEKDRFDIALSSLTFRVEEKIDDVYRARAFAVDKAGNESEIVEFDFSINRFGSNYKADDEGTHAYIRDNYYHNTTRDLEIHEYNTNAIRKNSQSIEVMKDGNTATVRKLEPGKDYDFEEDTAFGSHTGGRIYKYTIHSSVFEEEGDYSFTITSEDEAGHMNSTSRVHRSVDEETGEEKLFVDSFPIDFVIDKTPPTNQLAGISSDTKQSVNDNSLIVDVYPEDAQTAVSKVVINRWTGDTLGFNTPSPDDTPALTVTYEYYDEETNPRPADTEKMHYEDLADYTDDSGRIRIGYEMTDNQNWQWMEVRTTDLAGNESTDIRAGSGTTEAGASYSENRRGFLVTTDAFSQIINNMAARIGASAAGALFVLFLILWKRKKDQEKKGAA